MDTPPNTLTLLLRLSPAGFYLLIALSDLPPDAEGWRTSTQNDLARAIGRTRSTVVRAMQRLAQAEIIEVQINGRRNSYRPKFVITTSPQGLPTMAARREDR